MDPLLRFSGASTRDHAIDLWLDRQSDELQAIAREWFERMRACGDDVRELMHDGCPTACVDDAPFAYVNILRAHVNVGFFHGAALADPGDVLQGNGRFMRHVTVRPGSRIDSVGLAALIVAAYLDIKDKLRGAASRPIAADRER
jgi:hypothetical protein